VALPDAGRAGAAEAFREVFVGRFGGKGGVQQDPAFFCPYAGWALALSSLIATKLIDNQYFMVFFEGIRDRR
jgi:hypothetical protein